MNIPLSPIDYYFFRRDRYTIRFVFQYLGKLDIQRFEKALHEVIETYSVVGSRLKMISDREVALETGFPLSLKTRTTHRELENLSQATLRDLVDPVTNRAGENLFKVSVTQTPSRYYVGFSFSHLLGDGTSFFQFLTALSKTCKSRPLLQTPCNKRELLNAKGNHPKDLFDSTGYTIDELENKQATYLETFAYSNKKLETLKQESTALGYELSSNDLVMADLAKRFYRNIALHEGKFLVRCPLDYRKIMGLPPDYFGNAVRDVVTAFVPEEMEELDLFDIASRIHGNVQKIDLQNVLDSLESLDSLRKKEGITVFEKVQCPGLLVTNLSKAPVAEIDLGTGVPEEFYQASSFSRLAAIFKTADGLKVHFTCPEV